MNAITKAIDLDIAKNVFVAVGLNERGKVIVTHKLMLDEVLLTFTNMPAAMIGIEACTGSHYWVSKLNALGHDFNQRT